MKRLLILLFLLGSSASVASAREAWHDWCQIGNSHVITSGLSSTTLVQKSAPSCTITVYVHGGGLATIYADNNGTVLANPFTSQSDGQIIWYADNGVYDQTTSSAGLPQTVTLSGILLCDPFETGSTCNNGGATTAHNLLSTTHLDTIPFSPPVRGDLVTAQNLTSPTGATPAWSRLPLGSNLQVLKSNGTDDIWDYSLGVFNNGSLTGTRSQINFIPGTNISYTIADNPGSNSVDVTITNSAPATHVNHALQFTVYNSAGLAAGTTTASLDLMSAVPFACTINGYSLAIDTGTITVKWWKKATGTAIPTVSDSINTSGVSISSGTKKDSATLSDFTTTSVAANDSLIMDITAVTGATIVNGSLSCQE
jgi:hypothetical protein